jgi:hypothetical protein
MYIDHVCCSFSKRPRRNRYRMPKPQGSGSGPVVALLAAAHDRTRRESLRGWLLSAVGR